MLYFFAGLIIGFFAGIFALLRFFRWLANSIEKDAEAKRERLFLFQGDEVSDFVWREHLENYLKQN